MHFSTSIIIIVIIVAILRERCLPFFERNLERRA